MASRKNSTLAGLVSTAKWNADAYSGDKPNPSLPAFVRQHMIPCDPDVDDYNVAAYTELVSSSKATPIYSLHSYHQGKKTHSAIQKYIRHYTSAGNIILDPFSGSGSTAIASLLESRKAIAIDRSPAATFVTRLHCTPLDTEAFVKQIEEVVKAVGPYIRKLYETVCERCGGPAETAFTVYSKVYQCPRCLADVAIYDCIETQSTTASGKPTTVSACPHCHAKGVVEEINTRMASKRGDMPVAVSYLCEGKCKPKRGFRSHNDSNKKARLAFQEHDLNHIESIASSPIDFWVPPNKMMNVEDDSLPWGDEWRPGRNFRNVTDLFTDRNLRAIAAIWNECRKIANPDHRDFALGALTGSMLHLSKMSHHKEGGGGITVGTFLLPQLCKERNALANFLDKTKEIVKAQHAGIESIVPDVCISTQSACDLGNIPGNSIDYMFTDPPYGNSVQYGELNFLWEAWLGLDTHWHDDEVIVNSVRGKTEADWAQMMRLVMEECFRVLKPGRWLTLCFHDDEQTWQLLQDVMLEVGFKVDQNDKVLFIDTKQKSFNQLNASKSKKRDLILNFRKPKAGDSQVTQLFIPADLEGDTFFDLAKQVIKDFLVSHPGSPRDRVFDELVSRMVRRGEMEAHNFDALLSSIAEETRDEDSSSGRWYLRETHDQVDRAEVEKEDAAAGQLEKFMQSTLMKNPEMEGVHFSELFEQVVAIPVEERPRRRYENWLPEYFYKTTNGTWRPPADEVERQQKAAIREAGTLRRMKRFANALLEGVPVRDQDRPDNARTLAEWIRQCRRAGLYEQGRVMYEKGGLDLDRLNEDEQIEVEDDYRICVKRGSEEESPNKSKGRKKTS